MAFIIPNIPLRLVASLVSKSSTLDLKSSMLTASVCIREVITWETITSQVVLQRAPFFIAAALGSYSWYTLGRHPNILP
jgi:hypothetical protein